MRPALPSGSFVLGDRPMQTFLPLPNFRDSLACLDPRRLGKQRSEARTIFNTLINGGGWSHHPAIKMWRCYECAIAEYYNLCVEEWKRRGYVNNMEPLPLREWFPYPPWLGDEEFHARHRGQLLAKDPKWYGRFGWTEEPGLPYIWPVT